MEFLHSHSWHLNRLCGSSCGDGEAVLMCGGGDFAGHGLLMRSAVPCGTLGIFVHDLGLFLFLCW